jgi:hypothetical protein
MADAAAKLRFVLDEIVLPNELTVGEALAAGGDDWVVDEVLRPAFEVNDDGLPCYSLIYNELARGQAKSSYAAAIALAEAVLEESTVGIVEPDESPPPTV